MMNRTNTAVWLERQQRWQIKVQKDGIRKTFVCSTPGRKGQSICNSKADMWLGGEVNASIRVRKLYELFMKDQQDRTGTGNYINNESIGRIWILPAIGHKRMSSVSEQNFQDILNSAYKKGRSKKTISNIRGTITAFLRYARKSGATSMHADDLVISNKAESGERNILDANGIATLFNSDNTSFSKKPCKEWYVHAFRFMAVVGMRPGELCDLRTKYQKNGNAAVLGSYNKFGEHTKGKTKNAVRTFVLPERAKNILQDQRNMLKKAGIVSEFVFPDQDCMQSTSRELYKRWIQFQKHNGIYPVISLYELRHTFVSVCKGSISESLIKPVIGHSSNMPSYSTYGHVMQGELEQVAGNIDTAFNAILGNSK